MQDGKFKDGDLFALARFQSVVDAAPNVGRVGEADAVSARSGAVSFWFSIDEANPTFDPDLTLRWPLPNDRFGS
jgi:hypothetical protein